MKLKTGIAICAASLLISTFGCGRNEKVPYFGKYEGGFIVDRTTNRSITDAKRWNLTGYIQLFANKQKFKMHLEGEQEELDLGGVWRLESKMVILENRDFKLNDHGGATNRNSSFTFTDGDTLRAAYGKEWVLHVAKNGDLINLSGPILTIGTSVGHHEFKKDPRGR